MSEPRGRIMLIHRAPVDMTYQHTIDFKNPDEQLAYWGSKVKYRLTDYSYLRRERESISVKMPYDELDGINYMYFQSKNDSKWYFAFVTAREYVNPNATVLYFTIDVFQSFMFDFTFKPSYISQSHVDRWNAEYTPKYSRTVESLDYGSEYVTESAYKIKVEKTVFEADKHGFYLIYCKEHNELIDSGYASDNTVNMGYPIPYSIYVLPVFERWNIIQPYISYYDESGDAKSIIGITLEQFNDFMSNSAFGEYIQQIIYLPYYPLKYKIAPQAQPDLINPRITLIEGKYGLTTIKATADSSKTIQLLKLISFGIEPKRDLAEMGVFEGLQDVIPSDEMWGSIKANPRTTERDRRFESKLLCYPYRYNLFTDWTSTPIEIKNEYLIGEKIKVKESVSLSFNAPRRYWIDKYRNDPEGREGSITQSIPFELPIVSDAYYTYMLQNRNQISANIANAKDSAVIGTMMSVFGGAVGGVGGGGAGVLTGALTGGVSSGINNFVGYNNLIRSENAKQSDLRTIPDTIRNSNDVGMAIVDDSKYLTFYRKAITCDFEERLAQYWHMYGYKVNALDVPNIRSRVRFNYIKTIGANIEGAIENNSLAILKQIFDNGVTIWHYSDKDFNPLDYTFENPEVNLI